MNLNLFPFLISWSILAAVVLAMIAWRKLVARHEDRFVHVSGSASLSQQTRVAQKLDRIDKWGKTLTVVVLALGLLLAAAYFWQGWVRAYAVPDGFGR
jgi:hypothetical protein